MDFVEPIVRLAAYLQIYYPFLDIDDVKLSHKPGYMVVKQTGIVLNIQRVGFSRRDALGRYVSINQLWMDLHNYYNANVKVEKVREKTGLVTVIRWNGQRFSYDKNQRKKGTDERDHE